jgi:hypothetical protein
MAKLPSAKRDSLKNVPAGSLISVNSPQGVLLGFRVWVPVANQQEPAFVALRATSAGDRIQASLVLMRSRGANEFIVSSNTPVVNHTDGWSLHVDAKAWTSDFQMNFALEHAGLLFAEEVTGDDCGLRLAVGVPFAGACHVLRFDDWTLRLPTNMLDCAAASRWDISLPGNGLDLQWPLR